MCWNKSFCKRQYVSFGLTLQERIPFLEFGALKPRNTSDAVEKPPFAKDPVAFADSMPTSKPRVEIQ